MTIAASQVHVGQDRRRLDPQFGFESHHAFLQAVMVAGRGALDERLVPLMASANDGNAVHSGPAGGFLVPAVWAPRALSRTVMDPTHGRTQPVTMQHPIVHIAARVDSDHTTSVAAGVVMTRHVETESVDPARMQLDGIRLEAQELLGVSFATEKLVRDSAQTFVDLLERSYRDATDDTLLEERVRGRGVGEFLGVLHAPCTIIVEPESGQAAGTVVAENIVKMRQRCWNYGAAIWFLNIDHFSAIASAAIPAGVGGAPVRIWEPGNPEDGSPDRILGRPAFFHEVASAAGDVGDVILGNWGEYLDAEYIPLHGVSSMHVRFRAFEQAFRFYTRNDGQPWWRTVLQPRRSLSTLSPFLTLAAR